MSVYADDNARHVAWLTHAMAGDEQAWHRLVETFGGRLQAYVQRLGVPSAEAEDVVQETFIRMARTTARHAGRSSVATWIFAIGRNVARDHVRRGRSWVPIEMTDEPAAQVAEAPGATVDAQALWDFARRVLPSRQFEALWLHYAEAQPLAGVAQILGLSAVHARVLVHRARRRLTATWPAETPVIQRASGDAPQRSQAARHVRTAKGSRQ